MGRDPGKQSRPGKHCGVSDSRKQLALTGQMEQKAEEDPEGPFHRREPLGRCCGLSCGSWLGSTPLEEDSRESSVIRNPWTDGKGWGCRSRAEKERSARCYLRQSSVEGSVSLTPQRNFER